MFHATLFCFCLVSNVGQVADEAEDCGRGRAGAGAAIMTPLWHSRSRQMCWLIATLAAVAALGGTNGESRGIETVQEPFSLHPPPPSLFLSHLPPFLAKVCLFFIPTPERR